MRTRQMMKTGMFDSGLTRLNNLLSAFEGAGDEVGIYRLDAATETYWLCQHIGSARYWCVSFLSSTIAGKTLHVLGKSKVQSPFAVLDQTDGSFNYSGTWTHGISMSGTYGGTYSRTTVAGATATFTSPSNTYRVGLRASTASNAGVCKVAIDGDATRANLLSTAQELVDAGTLANTVLVANGGTLNPTDRVLDQYGAILTADVYTPLANDLTPGVHSVVTTCTGYKRAAASDVRLYLSGMDYCTTLLRMSTANTALRDVGESIFNSISVWEYALSLDSGALCGNGHGYESQTTLTIEADGVAQTINNGTKVTGANVTITRTTELFAPAINSGATQVANVTTVYVMHPTSGLKITTTLDWLVSADVTQAYVAMLPVDNSLDKGGNIAEGVTDALLLDDNDSNKVTGQGNFVTAWDTDGVYGVAAYVEDVNNTLLNWSKSDQDAFIQDRVAGFNKIYFERVGTTSPEAITGESQWILESYRKAQRFSDGADAVLAK
jgi:hypothetical protein